MNKKKSTRIIKSRTQPENNRPQIITDVLAKADNPLSKDDTVNSNGKASSLDLLPTPFPIGGLQLMVQNSTILKQCITAYKRNIVGFGAIPAYRVNELQEKRRQLEARELGLDDPSASQEAQGGLSLASDTTQGMLGAREQGSTDETPEMVAEWGHIEEFIKYFNFDQSFEALMSDIIEDREETGNGYMEIIRDGAGRVVGGHRLNPKNIKTTSLGSKLVDVEFKESGQTIRRKRKFRRYAQQTGSKTVWFKELGDPRKMNSTNGEFTEDDLPANQEANEIWHIKIGTGAYGMPRWIGQIVHMYGARKAEELNLKYFEQGRHTPMAIVVSNGHLSPQSDEEIAKYLESIEGVKNSHGFLVIEAEGTESSLVDGEEKSARVELKSLADMIQKDALFLDYDNKSREKVQSSFALPDIYIGRSVDFNRATAETSKEITEEQVFIPERKELEWQINHRLLQEYEFLYAELNFKKPETASVDETSKIVELLVQAKSISVNELREILGNILGFDLDALGHEYDKVGNISPDYENTSSLNPNPAEALTALELLKNKGGAKGTASKDLLYYNENADKIVNEVAKYLRNKEA